MSTTSAGRNHRSRPVAIMPPNAPSPISMPSVVPRTWPIGNYAKPWMLPEFWPTVFFPPHGYAFLIGRTSRIRPDLCTLITGRSRVKRSQCGQRYQRCALLIQTSRSPQKLSSNKSSMTSAVPSAQRTWPRKKPTFTGTIAIHVSATKKSASSHSSLVHSSFFAKRATCFSSN